MRHFFVIFFLTVCVCLEAQIKIVPKERLEQVNNPRLSSDSLSLRFDVTKIKADKMDEDGGIKTFEYPFRNVGNDTLVIKRIVSTCSCANAVCPVPVVAPGHEGVVKVSYNPKGHPGRFERKVFVYTHDGAYPTAILKLEVDVDSGKDLSGRFPVGMGNIRLRRNEIVFDKGVPAVERCVFVNVSDRPLRLDCERAMLPECLSFRTEPEIVEHGHEGHIVVTYEPSEGGERDRMPVILKKTGLPPSQARIDVIFR